MQLVVLKPAAEGVPCSMRSEEYEYALMSAAGDFGGAIAWVEID